jgi:hypothetical protein
MRFALSDFVIPGRASARTRNPEVTYIEIPGSMLRIAPE